MCRVMPTWKRPVGRNVEVKDTRQREKAEQSHWWPDLSCCSHGRKGRPVRLSTTCTRRECQSMPNHKENLVRISMNLKIEIIIISRYIIHPTLYILHKLTKLAFTVTYYHLHNIFQKGWMSCRLSHSKYSVENFFPAAVCTGLIWDLSSLTRD